MMMETKTRMTEKRVLALAAKKLPGRRIWIRHRKDGGAKVRQAAIEKTRELSNRKKEIDDAIREIRGAELADVIAAARFALDVDGDEPSWSQLRSVVELAEQKQALLTEREEVRKEHESIRCLCHRWTYELLYDDGLFTVVEAHSDTLDELAAKFK